jgi:hypothetical protein
LLSALVAPLASRLHEMVVQVDISGPGSLDGPLN